MKATIYLSDEKKIKDIVLDMPSKSPPSEIYKWK